MPELIALTCASGKQCSQLLPLLYRDPSLYILRLVVHSQLSLERLQHEYPNAEVVQANLSDPADCSRILQGVTTIYYVGPTFQQHEAHFGMNVIDAAMMEASKPGSSFAHFIYSSVMHPEFGKLLNHDRKRYVEEYLCESTLPYTILQPSHFADNAIGSLVAQKDSPHPKFMAAWDPEVAFSFSCICDFAEVSLKVIRERSKHFLATYQLVSTWPMNYTEYVKSVGDVIGRTIQVERVPYEQGVENMCHLVFGAEQEIDQKKRDDPERLLLYYNRRGIKGNPGMLEWLLGRPGTTPAQLARRLIDSSP